jgi:hypothetical protein
MFALELLLSRCVTATRPILMSIGWYEIITALLSVSAADNALIAVVCC